MRCIGLVQLFEHFIVALVNLLVLAIWDVGMIDFHKLQNLRMILIIFYLDSK